MFEDDKKKIIFIVVLLIALIAASIFAVKFFGFSNTAGDKNADHAWAVNIKTSLKKLNTDILNSAKFIKLKEYKAQHSKINDLDIGKDNPFSAAD